MIKGDRETCTIRSIQTRKKVYLSISSERRRVLYIHNQKYHKNCQISWTSLRHLCIKASGHIGYEEWDISLLSVIGKCQQIRKVAEDLSDRVGVAEENKHRRANREERVVRWMFVLLLLRRDAGIAVEIGNVYKVRSQSRATTETSKCCRRLESDFFQPAGHSVVYQQSPWDAR